MKANRKWIWPKRQRAEAAGWQTRLARTALLAVWAGLAAACAPAAPPIDTPNMLDPRGEAARIIAEEWWIQFAMGMAVYVVVVGILLYIYFARRAQTRAVADLAVDMEPAERGRWWIWIGGVIIPIVILAISLGVSLRSQRSLAAPSQPPVAVIEIIGHQWWWEVRYPDEGVVTANEIRIPVGQPVQIVLSSADVIHSFWVPQLGGKIDLVPGRVNQTWIQADAAGVFRGICAEFCGLQHARMQLVVVVESEDRYAAWLERERQPAPAPQDELVRIGQQVFMGSSCVYCHTVRGTNATSTVGPDLTHIASRLTLAAGIIENNPGNMAAWILDPQNIKPGNLMPPTNLSAEELQAMLAYLETLR
jgi:cytochrome c oxidase subunit II